MTQVHNLELGLVEPHTAGPACLDPSGEPSCSPADEHSCLSVPCKLTEGALDPLIQIINKDIRQDRPSTEPRVTRPMTGLELGELHSPPLSGPAFQLSAQGRVHLSKSWAGSSSRRILWESVSKAYVQVGYIQSLSLIQELGHSVIKGDQVIQAGPAFSKPILLGPDPLGVLYLLCFFTQTYLPHDLPLHQGQADKL